MRPFRRGLRGSLTNMALASSLALTAALAGGVGSATAQYAPYQTAPAGTGYSPYQSAPAARRDAAAEAWAQILARYPQSNDPVLNRRVQTVGQRLQAAAGARGTWDYRVIVHESPNAFVLPGGRVGVTTGLFRIVQNDDQLAAVLGHEIAHSQANHAGQRQQRTGLAALGLNIAASVFGRNNPQLAQGIARYGSAGAQLGILLPFSRNQELEADRVGVEYMAGAGYRPSQAVALWRNMQSARNTAAAPQFLSTHPNDATRIRQLEAYVRSRGYS